MKSFTDCLDSWALKLKAGTFCFEKSGSDFKSLVKSNFGAQWLETSDDELQALAEPKPTIWRQDSHPLPKIMILLNPDCKMLRKQQLWSCIDVQKGVRWRRWSALDLDSILRWCYEGRVGRLQLDRVLRWCFRGWRDWSWISLEVGLALGREWTEKSLLRVGLG